MKGIGVEKAGATAVVLDNLETPEPADDQVLVKSIYTAINPVYSTPQILRYNPLC
jgi:NADPH:quinone reductase-like Zn-dependent oxidoreductase